MLSPIPRTAGDPGAAVTSGPAVFLVSAVHAVSIGIAAPAHGDAVPVLALVLVELTAGYAVFLQGKTQGWWSAGTAQAAVVSCPIMGDRAGPSAPSSSQPHPGAGTGVRGPHRHLRAGRGAAPLPGAVPHQIHLRSRGPHRTSTDRRCSGHWHTRTRSLSRAGVLGTEHRAALSTAARAAASGQTAQPD